MRRYAQADGRPDDFAGAIAGAGGTGVGGKEAAEAAVAAVKGGIPDTNAAAAMVLKASVGQGGHREEAVQ